jgi:hypothetical protein
MRSTLITIHQYDFNRMVVFTGEKHFEYTSIDPISDTVQAQSKAKEAWGDEVLSAVERERRQHHGTITLLLKIKETGETREFFGQMARRITIEQKKESSADTCLGPDSSKSISDAWFVAVPPGLGKAVRAIPFSFGENDVSGTVKFAETFFHASGCKDEIARRTEGPALNGIPVLLSVPMQGQRDSHVFSYVVTEFSTARLDDSLFVPPTDFVEDKKPDPAEEREERQRSLRAWSALGLPVRIGVGAITNDTARSLNMSLVRQRFLRALTEFGITPVDLAASDTELALKEARQQNCDFVLLTEIGLSEVPDDENDPRPPYGHGYITGKLLNPISGKPERGGEMPEFSGSSDHSMAEAFSELAVNVLRETNMIRQRRARVAGMPTSVSLCLFTPTPYGDPTIKALDDELLQRVRTVLHDVVNYSLPSGKDFIDRAASYQCTWAAIVGFEKSDNSFSMNYNVAVVPRSAKTGQSSVLAAATGRVLESDAITAATRTADAIARVLDTQMAEIKLKISKLQ